MLAYTVCAILCQYLITMYLYSTYNWKVTSRHTWNATWSTYFTWMSVLTAWKVRLMDDRPAVNGHGYTDQHTLRMILAIHYRTTETLLYLTKTLVCDIPVCAWLTWNVNCQVLSLLIVHYYYIHHWYNYWLLICLIVTRLTRLNRNLKMFHVF